MKRKAYVFDADGTLFQGAHRLHLMPPPSLMGDPLAWTEFHAACGDDTVIEDVAAIARALSCGHAVIVVTYRPHSVLGITQDCVYRKARIPATVVCRPDAERISAADYKLREVNRLREEYDVLGVFEDDLGVAEALRSAGIPCYLVRDWKTQILPQEAAAPIPAMVPPDQEA